MKEEVVGMTGGTKGNAKELSSTISQRIQDRKRGGKIIDPWVIQTRDRGEIEGEMK